MEDYTQTFVSGGGIEAEPEIRLSLSDAVMTGTPSGGSLSKFIFGQIQGERVFLKLSKYESPVRRFDVSNVIVEVICSRLGSQLNLDIVQQKLTKVHLTDLNIDTVGVLSKDYTKPDECILTGAEFVSGSTLLNFQTVQNKLSRGQFQQFQRIFIFDYLIGNTDRHMNNIEFLVSNKGVRVSPIYDCGQSLFAARIYPRDFSEEWILADFFIQSFFTSIRMNSSLREISENLYSPESISFAKIFDGLQKYVSQEVLTRTQKYIMVRYEYLQKQGYITGATRWEVI